MIHNEYKQKKQKCWEKFVDDKIDTEEVNEIKFTSRFPKPEWYEPKDKKDGSD